MQNRRNIGKLAEDQALEWFLRLRPSKLISRNFYCRWGEIDLIFEEQSSENVSELVFVEVRLCTQANWLTGPETITHRKKRRLFKTGEYFLTQYLNATRGLRISVKSIRFDLLHGDGKSWKHIPNISLFS